ncbi:MAG: hypothetical protein HQK79_20140 [Desulfobacterales bacterium]|nr:hypothetical protein [Desulfobacterales bacterium]MBF0397647.1 hypothetical protein [Desulfobacterales bacterium]
MKKLKNFAILFLLNLFLLSNLYAEITPNDVYYLGASINSSLKKTFDLKEEFNKEVLAETIYPRNVFQKSIDIVNHLIDTDILKIDKTKFESLKNVDMTQIKPENTYNVLLLIKDALSAQFIEYTGEKASKKPADAFHQLREISFNIGNIIKKKDIKTNYGTPNVVYDLNVNNILPAIYEIAKTEKFEFKPFIFPKNPVPDIKPKNIFEITMSLYKNISEYLSIRKGYKPIEFNKIKDLDSINPQDVIDLTAIIISELQAEGQKAQLDPQLAVQYNEWKKDRKVVPGDTYQLAQHEFFVSKSVLKSVKQ